MKLNIKNKNLAIIFLLILVLGSVICFNIIYKVKEGLATNIENSLDKLIETYKKKRITEINSREHYNRDGTKITDKDENEQIRLSQKSNFEKQFNDIINTNFFIKLKNENKQMKTRSIGSFFFCRV